MSASGPTLWTMRSTSCLIARLWGSPAGSSRPCLFGARCLWLILWDKIQQRWQPFCLVVTRPVKNDFGPTVALVVFIISLLGV